MVTSFFVHTQRIVVALLALASMTPGPVLAQDEDVVPEVSAVGSLIDYARDVAPIMTAKCLKCHGPEEAKNDFRVDEADSLLSYIEPGDVESSSLWTDYLVTDDPDMRMPPTSVAAEEQLTGVELATIKLWIEEGGTWNMVAIEPVPTESLAELPLPQRIWKFQGLFHPATTHFPVALLTVSALFVLLSFMRPDTCEPVAFHCLWIGALGAVVASAAGWSYAEHEGYGAAATFDLQNSAIDRHRWLGIAVAVLSIVLVPVASYVRRTEDFGMRFIWLLGSLLLMGAVAMVGYQGGELTYGEGHYEQEFMRLFPATTPDEAEQPASEEKLVESDQVVSSDKPVTAEPTNDEPVVTESEPTTSEPVVTDEPTTEPVVSEPTSAPTDAPTESANDPAENDPAENNL
jgi:uncharacterized membrane protein